MNNEIKQMLKGGKWKYNILQNKLHLQRGETQIILKNMNNEFFQQTLSYLTHRGIPEPHLECNITQPDIQVPLETFHRILRANVVLYEPILKIQQDKNGLKCTSEHVHYTLNTEQYPQKKEISIDPFELYKITRVFRDRERVPTTISFDKTFNMRMEFPWIILNMKIPPRKIDTEKE